MKIIPFPGKKKAGGADSELERAARLKKQIIDFTIVGPLQQAFENEREAKGLFDADEASSVLFTDWFIFNWESGEGLGVLDLFIENTPDLDPEDLRILEGWFDPVEDVFKIVSIDDDAVMLEDHDGGQYYTYPTSRKPKDLEWSVGAILDSRILPLGERYIFSGIQRLFPDWETAEISRDPRILISKIMHDAFIAFFKTDEVTLKGLEFLKKMGEYQHFAFEVYQSPLLQEPLGALIRSSGGHTPQLVDFEPDPDADIDDEEIALLSDPREGISLVPDYPYVRQYLDTGKGDEDDLAELIYEWLEADHVLAFVFHRMAAISTPRLQKLLRLALDDPDFSVNDDLEDMLAEFKAEVDIFGDPDADDLDDFADEEDELVEAADIEDVLSLPAEMRPAGSIADALYSFLRETTPKLKPDTAEEQILAANLFLYYATEDGLSHAQQIDADALMEFLGIWYTRMWSERSTTGARVLLTLMGKFTAWLDKTHNTTIGSEFKKTVLPALKDDLPRTVKASNLMTDHLTFGAMFSVMDALRNTGSAAMTAQSNPEESASEGFRVFTIVDLKNEWVSLRERFDDDEPHPNSRIYRILSSVKAIKELRRGDVVEGVVLREGSIDILARLAGVYPSAVAL